MDFIVYFARRHKSSKFDDDGDVDGDDDGDVGDNRDFKIGHYGRLGGLDKCHVTQNTRDLLPSSFWDGMFSPGFSS